MRFNYISIPIVMFFVGILTGCQHDNLNNRRSSGIKWNTVAQWEPIYYKGRNIIKVGDYNLVFPVTLPNHINPLGNRGLMGIYTQKRINYLVVSFYFDVEHEEFIRRWAVKMKKNLWIPEKDFLGKPKYGSSGINDNKIWNYDIEANTIYGRIGINFSGAPNDPNEKTALMKGKQYKMSNNYFKLIYALWGRYSPVKGIKRLIELDIKYPIEHNQQSHSKIK